VIVPCILVVEDDENIRSIFATALRDEGYRVETAVDGRDALAHLGCAPDLITLDLTMPSMDGYEFLQRLRQLPLNALTPVLVVSATGGTPAGAQGVLEKPFEIEALFRRIAEMLPH
jgi:CheY-like chemotaxis protein